MDPRDVINKNVTKQSLAKISKLPYAAGFMVGNKAARYLDDALRVGAGYAGYRGVKRLIEGKKIPKVPRNVAVDIAVPEVKKFAILPALALAGTAATVGGLAYKGAKALFVRRKPKQYEQAQTDQCGMELRRRIRSNRKGKR